ncbi:hypothetical protein Btru_019569 [Bulinus truncatus]|nr:hypothetical protein Btru_019569 [Bulinus truncatus]
MWMYVTRRGDIDCECGAVCSTVNAVIQSTSIDTDEDDRKSSVERKQFDRRNDDVIDVRGEFWLNISMFQTVEEVLKVTVVIDWLVVYDTSSS